MPNYEEKDVQREIRQIFNSIGLCGCGRVDKYRIIESLLSRARNGGCFYDPLGDELNAMAVEFIADVMSSSHWDLLEHGTGIGYSWLTEKGAKLLQFFGDFGSNSDKWPEWWCSCEVGEEF